MCTKWTRTTLLIAMLAAAPAAWAGGTQSQKGGADPATKALPATTSDSSKANAFGQHAGTGPDGGADPSTKALPAAASDNARANAFGQQGARSKAAHQAARAAAAQAAHAAATQGQPAGAGTVRPSASATTHASTTGVTNGFDHATAGATNGQGSTHRH